MAKPERNVTLDQSTIDRAAARKSLVQTAKQLALKEDVELEGEGLDISTSYEKIAAYRGVGLGLFFKLLPWLMWMMLWMILWAVPFLIVINTSVFTDEANKHTTYGVKNFDTVELPSFSFAAIVDDAQDNATLVWMNTNLADTWRGPMKKGAFLTWIAFLDAGATLFLLIAIVALFIVAGRWLQHVDDKTREVSDYAVIVGGLPPTVTATEVGKFFEDHFGQEDPARDKVMDVVLVKDLSKIIHACKKVHKYEQLKAFVDRIKASVVEGAVALNMKRTTEQRQALEKAAPDGKRDGEAEDGRPSRVSLTNNMSRHMSKAESKVKTQQTLISSHLESGMLETKAAFVTCNTEKMRMLACRKMPSGWWSALLWGKKHRLEHGGKKWRVWAMRASAPDDYNFEHLSWRIRTNMLIQVFTGAVLLLLVIICAAFISWLSSKAAKEARNLSWNDGEVVAAISERMSNATTAARRHLLRSVELGSRAGAIKSFCTAQLPTACTSYVNLRYPNANVSMAFGEEWKFGTSAGKLLYERSARRELKRCAEDSNCDLSYCMPCYCVGLSTVPTSDASSDFMSHIDTMCSEYWPVFDVRRDGIKTAISLVIALINFILAYVLRLLKFYVEKHWTCSGTELSFAIWTYLTKVINSVGVLLIVNCSTLSKLESDATREKSSWLNNFVLGGLYDDFEPAWYEDVGFSIMVLMLINLAGPFVRTAADYGLKLALRLQLLFFHFGKVAPPEEYFDAFRTPPFTLENRVADVAFNMTLALMFGSGLPLCYLICAAYIFIEFWWDRANLLTLHQPAQRYDKRLPGIIMELLPLLVVVHLAFGLWMHTYFRATLDSLDVTSTLINSGVNELNENAVGRRITQPNGLPLFILFVICITFLVLGRWAMRALWSAFAHTFVLWCKCLHRFAPDTKGSDMTYEESLVAVRKMDMLHGARTYRLHHLPRYREYLSGDAGRLWAAAQGEERYTRLVSYRLHVEVEVGKGAERRTEDREVDVFDISADVIQRHLKPEPSVGPQHQQQRPQESTLLSGIPSAALQAALLGQVAALQANTGGLVTRMSMRPSTVTTGGGPRPAYDLLVDGTTVAPVPAAVATSAPGQPTDSVMPSSERSSGPAVAATSSAPAGSGANGSGGGSAPLPMAASAPPGGALGSDGGAAGGVSARGGSRAGAALDDSEVVLSVGAGDEGREALRG